MLPSCQVPRAPLSSSTEPKGLPSPPNDDPFLTRIDPEAVNDKLRVSFASAPFSSVMSPPNTVTLPVDEITSVKVISAVFDGLPIRNEDNVRTAFVSTLTAPEKLSEAGSRINPPLPRYDLSKLGVSVTSRRKPLLMSTFRLAIAAGPDRLKMPWPVRVMLAAP